MKKIFFSFLVISIAAQSFAASIDKEIRELAEVLKRNTTIANGYGAHQHVITKKLSADGKVQRIEEKFLRTEWISGRPTNVLVQAKCADYKSPIRNSRECVSFVKAASTSTNSPKPGKIEAELKKVRWTEMYKNFDFEMSNMDGPYRVIVFRPKANGVQTQNRIEKVLSKMGGKVWIDDAHNIVKAEAKLAEAVSFGLGVAAKIYHIGVQYDQQKFEDAWLPAHLTLEFQAKVALVRTERQNVEVSWSKPYRHSDSALVLRTGATNQGQWTGER